jgi:hypothetical protein
LSLDPNQVHHRAVSKNGKVKRRAIEAHQKRAQVGDSIHERLNKLGLPTLFDVRCPEGADLPTQRAALRNESSDAPDFVEDVLWEFLSERLSAAILIGFGEVVHPSNASKVRDGL